MNLKLIQTIRRFRGGTSIQEVEGEVNEGGFGDDNSSGVEGESNHSNRFGVGEAGKGGVRCFGISGGDGVGDGLGNVDKFGVGGNVGGRLGHGSKFGAYRVGRDNVRGIGRGGGAIEVEGYITIF